MRAIEKDLADEMQRIVFDAASPAQIGDTIKRQMTRAWDALGHPAFWRIRAAWYREAGFWKGVAHEDMRRRHAERQRKEANARDHATEALATLRSLRDAYAASDADFHREQILALDDAIARVGGGDRAVDEACSEEGARG